MRRRDPIKRALFAGGALALLMLGWIGITQMNVMAARRELSDYDARLNQLDDSSKELRADQRTVTEIQSKLKGLEKYAGNRFFWGTLLDAVQQLTLENVRLMEIKADQRHNASEPQKFYSTNIVIPFEGEAPGWKFWARSSSKPNVEEQVSGMLANITNRPAFQTNSLPYSMTMKTTSTNKNSGKLTVRVEFTNPAWAKEETIVEIRGRDYGTPSGAAVDEFARRISASPYFKDLLVPVEGFKFTERPPQPRPDPQDPVNPTAMFVPFTIQLTLKERVFTNE